MTDYQEFFKGFEDASPAAATPIGKLTSDFPRIPKDLLEKLESCYPKVDFTPHVTINEIMRHIGNREIILRLRAEFNRQTGE